MEIVGQIADTVVIDDFAHHPTAVQTTLEGARRRYPDNHHIWFFEPEICHNLS